MEKRLETVAGGFESDWRAVCSISERDREAIGPHNAGRGRGGGGLPCPNEKFHRYSYKHIWCADSGPNL